MSRPSCLVAVAFTAVVLAAAMAPAQSEPRHALLPFRNPRQNVEAPYDLFRDL